jgi:hypothetical protein
LKILFITEESFTNEKSSDSGFSDEFTLAELVNPNPSALVLPFRAIGYDLKTAIADLIDNSITAGSKNIWIGFHWDGDSSTISILDDGSGMDLAGLVKAMRPGSFDIGEERNPDDLGRFGLGLKTASFSQCRNLTVITKIQRELVNVRAWDLDQIVKSNEWRLVIPEIDKTSEIYHDFNQLKTGTLILWRKMDRITGEMTPDSKADLASFHHMIEVVEEHISMTFHRYMEGRGRIHFFINKNEIEPWDPFLQNHPATQPVTIEDWPMNKEIVRVEPYILPHYSKLTKKEHERAAGPKGWNSQQGFYIYRKKRLLVSGSWLNLGLKKDEHCKLARILIDIPNSLDSEWQIDVKKAVARPPNAIKNEISRIATIARGRASRIFRHRGNEISRSLSSPNIYLWKKILKRNKVFYRINREHPLFEEVQKNNSKSLTEFNALIRAIEETIPIPLIVMTNSEKPDSAAIPFEDSSFEEITGQINTVVKILIRVGHSPEKAILLVSLMEEFRNFQEAIDHVAESYDIKKSENFNEGT